VRLTVGAIAVHNFNLDTGITPPVAGLASGESQDHDCDEEEEMDEASQGISGNESQKP
jgi:hypothetical protein